MATTFAEPWKITDEQAAAEVRTWSFEDVQLRPAIITRKDLWADFAQKETGWDEKLLNAGAAAIQLALSGPDVLDAVNFVKHTISTLNGNLGGKLSVSQVVDLGMEKVQDKIKDAAQDQAAEMAGFYLVEDKGLHEKSNRKFVTKVVGTGITIGLGLIAGASTAGLGALVGLGAAFVIWLNEREREKHKQRAQEIVNGMMTKYMAIRAKVQATLNEKKRTALEAFVKSNAFHDWQDDNLKETFTYIKNKGSSKKTFEMRRIDVQHVIEQLGTTSKTQYEALPNNDRSEFMWAFGTYVNFFLGTRDDLVQKKLWYQEEDGKRPWMDKNGPNAPVDDRFQPKVSSSDACKQRMRQWIDITSECRRTENSTDETTLLAGNPSLPSTSTQKFMPTVKVKEVTGGVH